MLSTVTQLLISNQKLNAENQATRLCVVVLVIFNTFPCSGIAGGIQSEGSARFFNPYPIVALNRGFTDGCGIYNSRWVAKIINFCYTITPSTCPIYVGFRPNVLGFSFCITIKFLISCDAETRSKNRASEAHINWTWHM